MNKVINAFGYEHTFEDLLQEDIDMIDECPVRYLISGRPCQIESFQTILDSDWSWLETTEREIIFFGYEILPMTIINLTLVLGITFEMEDAEDLEENEEVA